MIEGLGDFGRKYKLPAAGVVIALFSVAPVQFVQVVMHTIRIAVGIAIGVGLGLGLAIHVYEHLQGLYRANETSKGAHRNDGIRQKTSALLRSQSDMLEDGASYFALMNWAGYHTEERVLRGQVVREDSTFWKNKYPFTDVKVQDQLGPKTLHEQWPGLPKPVARELGRFVEHIVRDFIGGWCSKMDKGCSFTDETEKRKMGIGRDGTRIDHSTNDTPDATPQN